MLYNLAEHVAQGKHATEALQKSQQWDFSKITNIYASEIPCSQGPDTMDRGETESHVGCQPASQSDWEVEVSTYRYSGIPSRTYLGPTRNTYILATKKKSEEPRYDPRTKVSPRDAEPQVILKAPASQTDQRSQLGKSDRRSQGTLKIGRRATDDNLHVHGRSRTASATT